MSLNPPPTHVSTHVIAFYSPDDRVQIVVPRSLPYLEVARKFIIDALGLIEQDLLREKVGTLYPPVGITWAPTSGGAPP